MPDAAHDAQPQRLGELLTRARDAKGLELSDVAEVTHVRKEYLRALDEGRYADLPEDVYTRNFLRLYAMAVGVDTDAALDLYARERREALGFDSVEERLEAQRAGGAGAAPAAPAAEPARPATAVPSGRPDLGVLVPTLLVVVAVVALAVWGFNRLLGTSGRPPAPVAEAPVAAGDAPPGTDASPAAEAPVAPGGSLADPAAAGTTRERSAPIGGTVFLSVTTEPAGAEVAVDGFTLSEPTPITRAPVTAGRNRVLRVTLDGYEPFEEAVDLSFDRNLSVALSPVASAAPAEAAGAAPAGGESVTAGSREGTIALTVTEPTWLEVYASTARNQGERLVYTTAQPGARYEFPLPVYVHVGNAAGVRASVEGRDVGPLGSSGAVVSRAFTQ